MRRGIAAVPEARRLFPRMTVFDNLMMGAFIRDDRDKFDDDLDRVYQIFPRIKERRSQIAGTLSGGEQQMVAMARALMAHPRLLCMDEPSMGLSPAFVESVFEIIQEINKLGTTIFVVEQNANMALSIATRGYVLQTGEVVLSGRASDLLENETGPDRLPGRNGRGVLRRDGCGSQYDGKSGAQGRSSNHRHRDFQSRALPAELPGHRAKRRVCLGNSSGLVQRRKAARLSPRRRRGRDGGGDGNRRG